MCTQKSQPCLCKLSRHIENTSCLITMWTLHNLNINHKEENVKGKMGEERIYRVGNTHEAEWTTNLNSRATSIGVGDRATTSQNISKSKMEKKYKTLNLLNIPLDILCCLLFSSLCLLFLLLAHHYFIIRKNDDLRKTYDQKWKEMNQG